nr:hypothetical protein [Bacteroides fragilis]
MDYKPAKYADTLLFRTENDNSDLSQGEN